MLSFLCVSSTHKRLLLLEWSLRRVRSVRSSAGQRPNKVRLERAGSSLLGVKTVGLLVVPAALLLRTDVL